MDRERVQGSLVMVGWIYLVAGWAFVGVSFVPQVLTALLGAVLPGVEVGGGAALMTAIAGGVTAGLGAVALGLGRAREIDLSAAVRALALGLVVWFVTDSGASIAHGAWRNAVGNAGFLAIGLLPVLHLRRAAARPLDPLRAADSASQG